MPARPVPSRSLIPSRAVFLVLSLAVLGGLFAAGYSAAAARDDGADEDSFIKHLAMFTEVMGLVRQGYVDETGSDDLMLGALDGATDALDPFSIYVPAEGSDQYAEARRIGARHSGLMLLRERGFVYAVAVQPESPAAKAGVLVGDIIGEIDGDLSQSLPMWAIQHRLSQPPGTEVRLELLRGQRHIPVALELGVFPRRAAEYASEDGVATLRMHHLDGDSASEARRALDWAARQHDRLLLDLRGVAGGDMNAAYQVAALFADGQLGILRGRGGEVETFEGDAPSWHGRLVVLIDRGTLGAAEILATVLRQKVDAELVGEPSFGYAGRQTRVEIPSGGDLWITDAFYTGPDGEPVNQGLVPDLRVADTIRRALADEERDPSEAPEDAIRKRGLERLLSDEPLAEPEAAVA